MTALCSSLLAGVSLSGWWILCASGSHEWGSSYRFYEELWDGNTFSAIATTADRCIHCKIWR